MRAFLRDLREAGRLLRYAAVAPGTVRQSARVAYECGNQSLPLIALVMAFAGSILVSQACVQAQRLVGDLSPVGPAFLQLLVREFAPTLCGLMYATRVGAGLAAHLGSLRVTEQLDAMRLCGVQPETTLVVPHIWSGLVMMPALTVVGAVVACAVGAATASVGFELGTQTFLRVHLVEARDLWLGAAKSATYGALVPAVSAACGLHGEPGSRGAAKSATRAVIHASVTVLFCDFVISAVGQVAR